MSIEFLSSFDRKTVRNQSSDASNNTSASSSPAQPAPQPDARFTKQRKPISPRRREANRRNAQRSTGPRTIEGKRRTSQNALKHGLCAAVAIPPCEDAPTFSMFLNELRREMQPVTVMQNILFPQIANLIWRLRRLPKAQADLFQLELDKSVDPDAPGQTLSPSQILARRFSDDPNNGFALLARYERQCQNMLMRLQRQYDQLKKASNRPSDDAGDRVPHEYVPAAPTEAQRARQALDFERRKIESEQCIPPRNSREAHIDQSLWAMAEQRRIGAEQRAAAAAAEAKKQTQSKPTKNAAGERKTGKSAASPPPPVTKRSQEGENDKPQTPSSKRQENPNEEIPNVGDR